MLLSVKEFMLMIATALEYYNLQSPNEELIRHSENLTYKVIDGDKTYLLRIHKPVDGFNMDMVRMGKEANDLILGEVELLLHLAEKGNVMTQKIKPNKFGDAVTTLDDKTLATLLEWIDGDTLDQIKITESIAYEIGVMVGKMHNDLKTLTIMNRYSYDESLLTTMLAETDEALKQGNFSEKQAKIITNALSYMRNHFIKLKHKFMLFHADLSNSNLLLHNNQIVPIDFSMSGYCIPEIELAMIFGNINSEILNQNVLKGYKSACQIELDYKGIDSCSCLLILLFAIGQHKRFAKEEWFTNKLDEWCNNKFVPLVEDENISSDMIGSDLIPARLWKDVL